MQLIMTRIPLILFAFLLIHSCTAQKMSTTAPEDCINHIVQQIVEMHLDRNATYRNFGYVQLTNTSFDNRNKSILNLIAQIEGSFEKDSIQFHDFTLSQDPIESEYKIKKVNTFEVEKHEALNVYVLPEGHTFGLLFSPLVYDG